MGAAPETNRARLRAWQRSGQIHSLWPDIPPPRLLHAQSQIAACTQHLLDAANPPIAWESADDTDRSAIGATAFLSGMGGMLGYWSEIGRLETDPDVAALLVDHLSHGRRRAASLELQLQRVLSLFQRHELIPVVLKGSFTSRRYFPVPGTRSSSDIDLLIRPQQFSIAEQILVDDGFHKDSSQRSIDRSTWLCSRATQCVTSLELDSADNPWSIDLHRSIDTRYFRGVYARFATVPWTMIDNWEVVGHPAHYLAQPLLTAYLALHASRPVHVMRLIRVVELVLVVRQDLANKSLDWHELAELLDDLHLWRFVFPALEAADRLSPGLLEPGFRRKLLSSATRLSRRVVERLISNGFQGWSDRHLDEHLMWFRGPIELMLNASELIWPRGMTLDALIALQKRRIGMMLTGTD